MDPLVSSIIHSLEKGDMTISDEGESEGESDCSMEDYISRKDLVLYQSDCSDDEYSCTT